MIVKWKLVAFLAHLCAVCTGGKGWLQYSYNPELEGFIKLHTEPADWHSARVKCHMEGAFLASPWFAEFASVISKLQTDRPQSAVLYSGVHKTFAEGALILVEGKQVISSHPSDLMKLERCGVFLADGSTGEVECDEPLPFVCFRPADPELYVYTESETEAEYPTPTEYSSETTSASYSTTKMEYFTESTQDQGIRFVTESALSQTLEPDCGEGNIGYEFAEETGHCYKFHAQAVETWYDAKVACEEEGAYLAIVNSDVEAKVLNKLFKKYPAEKIHGAPYTDTAAIGYFKNEYDNWVTVNGESLQVAGYEQWRPEAPFWAAKLGFICRDGLLYGYVKDIRRVPFICEKPREIKTVQQTTTEQQDPILEQETTEPYYNELETADTSEQVTTEPNYDELETEETSYQETTTLTEQPSRLSSTLLSIFYCRTPGYEFSELTKHCYKFHAQAVYTWYDAKVACEEEGAYLAIINSDVEALVLTKLFKKYPAEKIHGASDDCTDTAAIGYYRNELDNWVTINGESLEEAGYETWLPDAPHSWAELGFFYRSGRLFGYAPAIRDVPFICEKEPSPTTELVQTTKQETDLTSTEFETEFSDEQEFELSSVSASKCGDISFGYEFSELTKHCYKFHAQAVHTWYDAKVACEEEGAYLAIVNSDVEAKVLTKLFEKYPADKIHGTYPGYTDTAAIGYYKNELNDWVTINGNSLEEAGYKTWIPGAPHPWAELGFLYRTGRLYGYVLAIRDVPFICEKEPSTQEFSPTTEKEHVQSNEEGLTEITEEKPVQTTEQETDWGSIEFEQEFGDEQEFELSSILASKCGDISFGYEYSELTKHCYKFHAQAVETWYDAKVACEEEGAYLAIINSDVEALVLKKLFEKYPAEKIHGTYPGYTDTAAIGYYRNEFNDWVTINGNSLKEAGYESWRPDAPHPWAKLGFFYRDGLLYGYGPAIPSDVPFICEKEHLRQEFLSTIEKEYVQTTEEAIAQTTEEEPVQTTDWGTTDLNKDFGDGLEFEMSSALVSICGDISLGYEYSELTKHCYKFHAQAVETWYDAKVACEEEGAYLAIVNSDVEAKVLTKLFEKYPAEKIRGALYTDTAAIGYYRNEFDDWVTINGKSLEEAGYKTWIPGAPHPWAELGFLYRTGRLYGYVLAIRDVPFICEKEPSTQEFSPTTEKEHVQSNEEGLTEITEEKPVQTTEQETDWATTEFEQEFGDEKEFELSSILASKCGDISFGYEYSVLTKHCYKFHAQAVETWYDAKVACEEEDAYLAIINSDVEALVLKKLFEKYPAEKIHGTYPGYTDTAAIGYYRNEFNDWVTINGKSLKEAGYESWRPDAPHPWAKLGFFYRDGLLYGYVPAIRDVPFICEKEPLKQEFTSTTEKEYEQTTEEEPVHTTGYGNDWGTTELKNEFSDEQNFEMNSALAFICGDISLGYEYSELTKHCYKFHAQAVETWYDAKVACEEEGAYLAIINSDVEAKVLTKLFEKYPAEKIRGALYTDTAAIGYYRNEFDDWVTINGESLKEAGYETWRPNAPHSRAELGFFYRDGLLFAYVPVVKCTFICEKEPLKHGSTQAFIEGLVQTTEGETVSATEENFAPTTEEESVKTTEEELAETTRRGLAQTTEEESINLYDILVDNESNSDYEDYAD